MKLIKFTSTTLALLALSSLPLPSIALSSSSTSTFVAKPSATNSNIIRRAIQQSVAPLKYKGGNSALFSTASASALSSTRVVDTKLPGCFWRSAKSRYEYDLDWAVEKGMGFWKRLRDGLKFFFLGGFVRLLVILYVTFMRSDPVTIYDARVKEAEEGLSKADFFEKYGFVILNSTSAMTSDDWEASDRDQGSLLKEYNSRSEDDGAAYSKRMEAFRNADTPVKKIYAEETKKLVKSIIPRAKEIMPPAKGIRRSLGSGLLNAPAKFVHNDYGLNFDEIVQRNPFFDFDKQKKLYEETKSNEYMLVNLWRPIKPMSTPLRSLPLCFLDSSTLSQDDFVTIDTKSLGVSTSLKNNPNHKFYYYPDMTVDEVVVFKQFHRVRNETSARMPVFHTAFPDPAADENTEGRVSFEYRVGLLA